MTISQSSGALRNRVLKLHTVTVWADIATSLEAETTQLVIFRSLDAPISTSFVLHESPAQGLTSANAVFANHDPAEENST